MTMLDTAKRSHTSTSTGKARKLTYAETFIVGDAVRKYCKLEGKYAVYEEGWDDDRVVAELGGTFTTNNVAGIRRQLIGPIKMGRGINNGDLKTSRLIALEHRLEALELWASDQPKVPFVIE